MKMNESPKQKNMCLMALPQVLLATIQERSQLHLHKADHRVLPLICVRAISALIRRPRSPRPLVESAGIHQQPGWMCPNF